MIKEEKEGTDSSRQKCFADINGNNKRGRGKIATPDTGSVQIANDVHASVAPRGLVVSEKKSALYLAIFREKSRSTCDKDRSLVELAEKKVQGIGTGPKRPPQRATTCPSIRRPKDWTRDNEGVAGVVLQKTKPANDES